MSSDLGAKPDSESQTEVKDMPRSADTKNTEIKENVNSETADTMPDSEKSKTQPEAIQAGKDVPRLPPIGMNELETILKGPNMPSQKLMKEVTEKIRMKNDESGSDDGSVTSAGGSGVGIRGILDCILEASLFHQDSEDESDREGDEIFVRELPCQYCKKIFGSTMNLTTHVLMTHSQEDPSVLNMRNQSRDISRRERLSPTGRSKSTEGRDKEASTRRHVRSRHNSKEQSTKTSDKLRESSDVSHATAVATSKNTTVSSQKTLIQTSNVKTAEDGKKCDLKSSETSKQVSHSHRSEESVQLSSSSSSSKSTKRKSNVTGSSDLSTASKKVKRSQSQSGEAKTKSGVQLRRSSRRK